MIGSCSSVSHLERKKVFSDVARGGEGEEDMCCVDSLQYQVKMLSGTPAGDFKPSQAVSQTLGKLGCCTGFFI